MLTLTCCQDHILTENIWFVCSETSYNGDERRCYRCGTNDQTTKTEDRATQPMEGGGWVSQFKQIDDNQDDDTMVMIWAVGRHNSIIVNRHMSHRTAKVPLLDHLKVNSVAGKPAANPLCLCLFFYLSLSLSSSLSLLIAIAKCWSILLPLCQLHLTRLARKPAGNLLRCNPIPESLHNTCYEHPVYCIFNEITFQEVRCNIYRFLRRRLPRGRFW